MGAVRATVPENRENKEEAFWVAPLPVSNHKPLHSRQISTQRSGEEPVGEISNCDVFVACFQDSTIEPWSDTDISTRTHLVRGILTVAGSERGVGGEDYENLTSRAVMIGS